MFIRVENYDEYVKDFEKLRNNPEEKPGTEEELREIVEEACKMKNASMELARLNPIDYIINQNSVDGQYHEFNFDVEMNDDGQIILRYRPET